ncbi:MULTISPECIES: hypothetical protein [unclassified Neisseria]|uniref:hypothetical protein n=1 Tax=unclassified Neisseria TaxID=2623750 RepID=UPI002664E5A3|nr:MULTISPECIES: hypothetical protein [unclassified Neisseria]MDO1509141.1 hypothetical protein [Neisseria sp. MVDL19-042950]MDO1515580.1 hypothetical protein [Neisseria sp. MVDL18-041461]MDO1562939.1 hypothetical protein [Neisseria sp. MVDL20-010259]
MEKEKIYYAAVILISAVSVLLSPFFYVRRGNTVNSRHAKRQWKTVWISNILITLILLAIWWFWLR